MWTWRELHVHPVTPSRKEHSLNKTHTHTHWLFRNTVPSSYHYCSISVMSTDQATSLGVLLVGDMKWWQMMSGCSCKRLIPNWEWRKHFFLPAQRMISSSRAETFYHWSLTQAHRHTKAVNCLSLTLRVCTVGWMDRGRDGWMEGGNTQAISLAFTPLSCFFAVTHSHLHQRLHVFSSSLAKSKAQIWTQSWLL